MKYLQGKIETLSLQHTKRKEMMYRRTIELHETAIKIIECLQEADKRIECQEEYAANEQWQYLFPSLVKRAKRRADIIRLAKVRLTERYERIINQIQEAK